MDLVSWTESELVFFDIPNFLRRLFKWETSGRGKHCNTASNTSLGLNLLDKMTQSQEAEIYSQFQQIKAPLSLDDLGQVSPSGPQVSLKWGFKTATPTPPPKLQVMEIKCLASSLH